MFSLQLPKTSLRFQLADVPTGAPVDDREETIADTHAALSKLLADCKKYVGAVVASCVMVGGASMAQEAPQKNNIPVGTVATQPVVKNGTITIEVVDPSKGVIQKYEIVPSPSARLQATNGYGQTVDTPFGKLSFAEIQGHEKKDEIIAGLKPSKQARYNEWEEQTANQNIQAKLQVEQTKDQEGKIIDARIQAKDQEFIKKAIAYVETVENNDRLLNNPKVVSYLKKLLQNDTLPPDLLGRIDVLIGIGG